MSARPAGWFAAVVLAPILFFAPALLGDRQFLFRDTGRYYHPVKQWVAAELRAGRLPEWNPYQGLGVPVVGGAIDSVLHPFNLLFLALPFEPAFTWWVILCYPLAALGAMLLARSFGCRPAAAAAGAIAFALSGFLVSSSDNLVHLVTFAGVPWVLVAGRWLAARPGPARIAALGAASYLCAAGGELLDWSVAVALLLPLCAFSGPDRSPWLRLRDAAVAGLAAAVGAAPALAPFLAGLSQTVRSGEFAIGQSMWNLHPRRLLELVLPHLSRGEVGRVQNPVYVLLTGDRAPTPWIQSLYLGAPVVALAVVGGVRGAGRWLLAVAALLAWAAMGYHAGFGSLAVKIPVLSTVRYFERLAGWPTLLVGLAAALGLERILADAAVARRLAIGAGVAGGVALLAAGAARLLGPEGVTPEAALAGNVVEGGVAAGLALLLLAVVARRAPEQRAAPLVLVLLVAIDLAAGNATAYLLSTPALTAQSSAPIPAHVAAEPGLQRVAAPFPLSHERWPELLPFENGWRWGARTAAPAFHVADRIGNLSAYGGVIPRRLAMLAAVRGERGQIYPAGLVGVMGVVITGSVARAAELGVPPPWRVLAEDSELPAWLLAIPHRERAYLAGELVTTSPEGALEFLARADPARENRTVVEGPVPRGYAPPAGGVRVVAETGSRVELTAESSGPALLVLDDQLDEGWRAAVDGAPRPVVAVNYLVRGVWLEAGPHRVVFEYRTPYLRAAGALAAFCGVALLAAAALLRARRRPRPAP